MPEKPKDPAFTATLAFSIISFICNIIAFVTPAWIEVKIGQHNTFQRLGLWVACFDGYMHPNMYNKAYYGCWYIYYKEFDAVRFWLTPGWFYAVQILYVVAFICHIIALIVVSCMNMRLFSTENAKLLKTLVTTHFIAGCCLIICLIAMGIQSQDSRWMPNPELNTLSWAYALAVIAFVSSVCALICLFIIYLRLHTEGGEDEQNVKFQEAQQVGPGIYDPRAPPAVYTADSAL